MYGLINKALNNMVVSKFGPEAWNNIVTAAGLEEGSFVSMERYDDDVTYALVGAASEVLEAPPEACLEMFGHYWVTVTATEAYELLMESTGTTMVEFLQNVNTLHDRITSTFIGYIPPYFEVDQNGTELRVRYESEREGLTPFVVGLLKGLAERFSEEIELGDVERLTVDSGEQSILTIHLRG